MPVSVVDGFCLSTIPFFYRVTKSSPVEFTVAIVAGSVLGFSFRR
jgi:hypothetical protein